MPSFRFRRIFGLLCWEGAFAMAYDTWVGPVYLSGLAGEVAVSVGLVTALTTLPWIGWMGQLGATALISRSRSMRRYSVISAAISRAIWILPLAMAAYWGFRTEVFPTQVWFRWLAFAACFASLVGGSSTAAWYSWMRGLVPSHLQGRFFATRQRYTMVALVVANLIAAAWVGWKPGGLRYGYAAIGTLAVACAALSTWLLSRVPELRVLEPVSRFAAPDVAPGTDAGQSTPFLKLLTEPFKDPRFRPVLMFGGVFHGAIQFAGPYFPFYFTRDLHIPMSQIAMWTLLTNVGIFAASSFWGRRVDRLTDLRLTLWIVAHAIALSPLFYLYPDGGVVRWIAPFDYLTNGLAWAGYTVCMQSLYITRAPVAKNVAYFSVMTAFHGLMGAIATLCGGLVGNVFGFRVLFVAATVVRLLVIWTLGQHLVKKSRGWGRDRLTV